MFNHNNDDLNEGSAPSGIDLLKGKKGLKIASLNVRSLVSKIEQIEVLLSDEKLDLLGVSESWLKPSVTNNIVRIDNYKIYRWDRQANKRGGGVCVYVSRRIKVDAQINEKLNISDKDIELFTRLVQNLSQY